MEEKKRVKHFNYITDDENMGTVFREDGLHYFVYPDYNPLLKKIWLKIDCDIVNTSF